MWLFTQYGFFSVVGARTNHKNDAPHDPTRVMIRCRNPDHLDRLVVAFPDLAKKPCRRVNTPLSDYAARLVVPTKRWAEVAAALATEAADVGNFKHAVAPLFKGSDPGYLDLLLEVWQAGFDYQHGLDDSR